MDDINASGYGLTFGLHTRIDDRVQQVVDRVHAGNIYVNRNQIGAVVGSQPFGGEGLSGTGPKAGGPFYLPRLRRSDAPMAGSHWAGTQDSAQDMAGLQALLQAARPAGGLPAPRDLPGPTGESNRLSLHPRGPVLCLGPGAEAAQAQAAAVTGLGGIAVTSVGAVAPEACERLEPLAAVIWWGDAGYGRACEQALSRRAGPVLPLITGLPDVAHVLHERHVCIDTTAAGGNAALLAEVAG